MFLGEKIPIPGPNDSEPFTLIFSILLRVPEANFYYLSVNILPCLLKLV